jgi:hypothetical protein
MTWKRIEPDVWKPINVGDEIEGVLIKVDKEAGTYKSTVYHLETSDKKEKVVFGTTIIDDRMSYIKVGDRVKITYKGIQKNQRNQDVKIFEVFKEEQEVSPFELK